MTGETSAAIHATSIGGVRTFWAELPPPARAALVFRVGVADETLPLRGVTHLIEHLALSAIPRQLFDFNGTTTPLLTLFHGQGRLEDAVGFVNATTSHLSCLALDRIDEEKRILRAEESRGGAGSWAGNLSSRYGAVGHGARDYVQFGLRRLDGETAAAWARRWFVAENCALWLSFAPPPDLQPALPSGSHQLPAEPVSLPTYYPARFDHRVAGVGITMTGERSFALAAATRILQRRLFDTLRLGMALAYHPQVGYEPLSSTTAHVLAQSDAAKADAPAVIDAMLDQVRRLREEGATDEEIGADRDRQRILAMDPNSMLGRLQRRCFDHLLDTDEETAAELEDRMAGLTGAEVGTALQAAWQSALLFVPEGSNAAWRVTPAPIWSHDQVQGVAYRRRAVLPGGVPAGSQLVASSEGVSLIVPPARHDVTVRFANLSALLCWRSGDRRLIGTDGFNLPLRAGEWEPQGELLDRIARSVPDELQVPMDDPASVVDPSSLCEVCRLAPSTEVKVYGLQRRGRRSRRIQIRVCRDCGTFLVREWTSDSLHPRLAWVFLLILGPFHAVRNIPASFRLRRLARPQRTPENRYWRPGRPVLGRTTTLLGLAEILLGLAFLVSLLIGILNSPRSNDVAPPGPAPVITLPPDFSLPPGVTFPPVPT